MTEAPLVVITHGSARSPSKIWYPSVGEKFQKMGLRVSIPFMPREKFPTREAWVEVIAREVGDSQDVTLVSHSCSGRAALHYIEEHGNIQNLVIVSSFLDFVGDLMPERWRQFYSKPLNFETISKNCPNIVGLYSEDDIEIPYNQADSMERNLPGARVLRFKDQGHFLGMSLPVDLVKYLTF